MKDIPRGILVAAVLLLILCAEVAILAPAQPTTPVSRGIPTNVPLGFTQTTPATDITPMTPTQLAAIDSRLTREWGTSTTQPLTRTGTVPGGYPMYVGNYTDQNGTRYTAILIQTASPIQANAWLPTGIANMKNAGYIGTMQGTSWIGTTVDVWNGQPMAALVFVRGNNVVQVISE